MLSATVTSDHYYVHVQCTKQGRQPPFPKYKVPGSEPSRRTRSQPKPAIRPRIIWTGYILFLRINALSGSNYFDPSWTL